LHSGEQYFTTRHFLVENSPAQNAHANIFGTFVLDRLALNAWQASLQ